MKVNVLRVMVVAMLLAVLTLVSIVPYEAHASASCSTRNLNAYDMGTGSWFDPDYVIDVHGVSNSNGHFIYYGRGGWRGVRFSPWYLIDNGNGVRFGVSTWWTLSNPDWRNYYWIYVYPC